MTSNEFGVKNYLKSWFDKSDFIETLDPRSELTMSGSDHRARSS